MIVSYFIVMIGFWFFDWSLILLISTFWFYCCGLFGKTLLYKNSYAIKFKLSRWLCLPFGFIWKGYKDILFSKRYIIVSNNNLNNERDHEIDLIKSTSFMGIIKTKLLDLNFETGEYRTMYEIDSSKERITKLMLLLPNISIHMENKE